MPRIFTQGKQFTAQCLNETNNLVNHCRHLFFPISSITGNSAATCCAFHQTATRVARCHFMLISCVIHSTAFCHTTLTVAETTGFLHLHTNCGTGHPTTVNDSQLKLSTAASDVNVSFSLRPGHERPLLEACVRRFFERTETGREPAFGIPCTCLANMRWEKLRTVKEDNVERERGGREDGLFSPNQQAEKRAPSSFAKPAFDPAFCTPGCRKTSQLKFRPSIGGCGDSDQDFS